MWSEDPLGHWGRNISPSWSAFGRGGMASWDKSGFTSIETEIPAKGSKPWCWLFAALYHKLQAPM